MREEIGCRNASASQKGMFSAFKLTPGLLGANLFLLRDSTTLSPRFHSTNSCSSSPPPPHPTPIASVQKLLPSCKSDQRILSTLTATKKNIPSCKSQKAKENSYYTSIFTRGKFYVQHLIVSLFSCDDLNIQ